MPSHLEREVENLKKKIFSLSTIVEESVSRAVKSIGERDASLAERVIEADHEIDQMEIDVEEECLKILALHQPVAIDLRFIIVVLKMNNDLERIGDLAVNIAERSLSLSLSPGLPKQEVLLDFIKLMAQKAKSMLRKSLDALVNLDANLAREVCASDDEVDELYRNMFNQVRDGIKRNLEQVDYYLQLLGVSRHLERIADHATNISEDVMYMVEGEISRHKTEFFRAQSKR